MQNSLLGMCSTWPKKNRSCWRGAWSGCCRHGSCGWVGCVWRGNNLVFAFVERERLGNAWWRREALADDLMIWKYCCLTRHSCESGRNTQVDSWNECTERLSFFKFTYKLYIIWTATVRLVLFEFPPPSDSVLWLAVYFSPTKNTLNRKVKPYSGFIEKIFHAHPGFKYLQLPRI